MWYFLSEAAFGSALTEVRTPQMAYQESTTPRLCIAPSVSQCILALAAREGTFHVHTIEVNAPEPADETVGDRHKTGECWITQEVLDRHGGSIPIQTLGQLDINRDVRTNLKIAIIHGNLPKGWETKERDLWDVKNGRWTPKFKNISDVKGMLGSDISHD